MVEEVVVRSHFVGLREVLKRLAVVVVLSLNRHLSVEVQPDAAVVHSIAVEIERNPSQHSAVEEVDTAVLSLVAQTAKELPLEAAMEPVAE